MARTSRKLSWFEGRDVEPDHLTNLIEAKYFGSLCNGAVLKGSVQSYSCEQCTAPNSMTGSDHV